MSIYLVDYENVNADGFKGIEQLGKEDSVYIFYTTNAGSITFEIHKKLIESSAEMKYFSVSTGKNALDFQLAMFAGYLLGKGIKQNIYIISNDKGFDSNVSFYDKYLIAEDVDVVRHTSIAASLVEKEKAQKTVITQTNVKSGTDTLYNSLCTLLPGYSSCDIINISAVLLGVSDKQDFHTQLVARFKQEKGEEIYTALKSDFVSLKKYDEIYQKLSEIVKDIECSPTDIIKIIKAVKNCEDKQALHKELVAVFGQSKGSEIYRLVRKEYTNITKTA